MVVGLLRSKRYDLKVAPIAQTAELNGFEE